VAFQGQSLAISDKYVRYHWKVDNLVRFPGRFRVGVDSRWISRPEVPEDFHVGGKKSFPCKLPPRFSENPLGMRENFSQKL